MILVDALRRLVVPLDEADVPYLVVGSVASISYGEPRTTRDVDLVVAASPEIIGAVTRAFSGGGFYVPPAEVLLDEILRKERGFFNVIDHETDYKADFHVLAFTPFNAWAFARRRRIMVGDVSFWAAPPEMVILGKLEYYREGGSNKHVRDIRAMLAISADIDLAVIEREVGARGLEAQWLECTRSRR